MRLSEELVEAGDGGTWASVWWAYGAIHYELTRESYDLALIRLAEVVDPGYAVAASLMLTAEIELTRAIESKEKVDNDRQVDLLAQARAFAPDWPSIHLRMAYPLREIGKAAEAKAEIALAVQLLPNVPSQDPFDVCISGRGTDRNYVLAELDAFEPKNSG